MTAPDDLWLDALVEAAGSNSDAASQAALVTWSREVAGTATPPPALRRRLLNTVAGPGRFEPFVESLRRTFDLGTEALGELFRRIDNATGWSHAPAPGVRYFHFVPGPAASAFECGVVRLAAGSTFPRHRHRGPETSIIIEGVAVEAGRTYGPGAIIESPAGSAHDYTAGPGRDLIVVSRHGGIDFEITTT